MAEKIAIVGAGVGGLACAARLAKDGYAPEVFEKLNRCGGRCNLIQEKGFKFDTGPSFVLMPDFFEELFSYCGERLEDYLKLKALDVHYKIFYPDGETLTVFKDSRRTKEELERIEPNAAAGFDQFIRETSMIYSLVRPLLYRCFSPKALLNPSFWPLVYKLRVFQSYWHLARRFFKSEKLCYAFTFEAMFMGVSPFAAPAFYSVISYADHVQKIYHPLGGMYEIPLALEKMAQRFGARFNYQAEVKKISRERGGFSLEVNGQRQHFKHVVCNADYAYAQTELLNRIIPDYRYSCSVLLFYWGLNKKVPGLAHHNLFFAQDLRKNLRQIFRDKIIPEDPSFYIHVPTVTDPGLAPQEKDLFYVLIPVPNLKGCRQKIRQHEQELKRIVFEQVRKVTGERLEELIEVEHKFYPEDFIDRYNIKFAATFGLAHNLTQSAFFRPTNYDRRLKELYFVGASTQPGGGLPVVLAGSRIVADLLKDALSG